MMAQLKLPIDKRWCERREAFVAPPDRIDPSEYGVEPIREAVARDLIARHHYSGSFPAARLSVGLWRRLGVQPAALVGAAVFSVPMQRAAIPAYTGLDPAAGVELGRFVCLPEVAFNGETWFLRRAIAALRQEKPEIRAVLSYSDPMERQSAAGLLTKAAHYGQIYQAHNAAFVGRTAARYLWAGPDGSVISGRALSKIRSGDRGHEYAARQLLAWGADARRAGETPTEWLYRVLQAPMFRRLRHPGNFAYVFGLDPEARRFAQARSLTYPKRAK